MSEVLLCFMLYMLVGCICLTSQVGRMAEYEIWVLARDDASYSRFLWQLLIWPSTLIFLLDSRTKAKIAAAKHGQYPWAYAPDGTAYSLDERTRRLDAAYKLPNRKEK